MRNQKNITPGKIIRIIGMDSRFKFLKFFLIIVFAFFIVNFIIFNFLLIKIPAGYVGVRTNNLGILGKKGVVPEDFGPGYHRNFLFLDSWKVFDSTVQTLELSKKQYFEANKNAILYNLKSQSVTRQSGQQVRLTTSEGYNVDVDVTTKYKIKKGEAYKLLQELGSEDKYKVIVKNIVLDTCRQIFGEMTTEDFYNPYEKRKRIKEAKKHLQKELGKRHIELVELLIRNVSFDPNYEKKIREKKLADQDIILNKSIAAATRQKAITDKIIAETEAMVKIKMQEKEAKMAEIEAKTNEEIAKIKADYMKYVTQKKADADLYAAKKQAEGKLLIKKAQAEGEKLLNEALSSAGGARVVALDAAKNIQLKNFVLSSGQLNPIDLDAVYKMLLPDDK